MSMEATQELSGKLREYIESVAGRGDALQIGALTEELHRLGLSDLEIMMAYAVGVMDRDN